MIRLFLEKILSGLLTLVGVATLIFFLFNVMGDPTQMMVDQNATQSQVKKIQQKYGFDLPGYQQFLYYLNDLSPVSIHSSEKQDFSGYSQDKYGGFSVQLGTTVLALKWPYLRSSYQRQGKRVTTIIRETLPNTFLLAVTSIGLAIVLGMILGVIAGYYKGSATDKLLVLLSTFGMSVPSFFSAILFSWIFGQIGRAHV